MPLARPSRYGTEQHVERISFSGERISNMRCNHGYSEPRKYRLFLDRLVCALGEGLAVGAKNVVRYNAASYEQPCASGGTHWICVG
jgi:hypothetical protein